MRLFRKKDDGGSSASKSSSPAPNDNPYAQQSNSGNPYAQQSSGDNPYAQGGNPYAQGGDPYAQKANPYDNAAPSAYAQARQNAYGEGNRVDAAARGDTSRSSAYAQARRNAYGTTEEKTDAKFGANNFGASNGYGSDRYNTGEKSASSQPASRYGAGGYGGFQGRDPYNKQDDPNRNALFGGASGRAAQDRLNTNAAPPPYDSGSSAGDFRGSGQESAFNSGESSDPYASRSRYDDRQLTAEEEEEEQIKATKQDIRAIKQKDVAATRNALRLAQQADEVGRDTLARLGVQSDMIHTTAHNLELAHNQNKIAEDKAKELKTLNRSMFAIHVGNPLTAKSRDARRDEQVRARHEEERAEREAGRRAQYLSNQRMEKNFNELNANSQNSAEQKKKNLAERAKYQFEADSEDEEMENEIDNNLNALSGAVNNIRLGARLIGQEVEAQNAILGDIHQKSDKVDVGLTTNAAKLARIGKS